MSMMHAFIMYGQYRSHRDKISMGKQSESVEIHRSNEQEVYSIQKTFVKG